MNYPKKLAAVLSSATAAVCLTAPAYALPVARSVPPASFLDYHVDTVAQLTFEVAYDKAVRARLARHFRLSGPAMSAYVRDDLVLQHLRAPLRTRVYCVSPGGREFFVLMTLKAGTPVFALRRTGKPILRLVCGNPLVSALPAALKQMAAAKPRPVVRPLAKTLVEATRSAQAAPASLVAADTAPAAWSVPSVLTSGPGETLFTQGVSGGGWLAWLPVVLGLGGAIAGTHHDSGSGGGQTVAPSSSPLRTTGGQTTPTPFIPAVPPGGAPDGPAPVPEPGPGAVFALGILTLGVLRLRRK